MYILCTCHRIRVVLSGPGVLQLHSCHLGDIPQIALHVVTHVNINKYNCCEEIYPDLFFNFTIEKKEGFSNSAATFLVDTRLVLFSGLYCCLKRFLL